MLFYSSPLRLRPLFYVDNRIFRTDGKTYCGDDIVSVEVNCILGRFFPARKHLDRIDELVSLPPLFRLYGSIRIKTIFGDINIPHVYRVMEAYMHLKRICPAAEAYYIFGRKRLKYTYKSIFDGDYFKRRHYFSSLYILNEGEKYTQEQIRENSRIWAEKCGYRTCADGEASTFSEFVMTNEDDRWISIYADSIEGNYAPSIISSCEIYSMQHGGRPVLYVEVFDKRIVMIAYGEGEKTELYFCGDESLLELLKCTKDMLSSDFSVPEKAAVSDKKTFRQILENTDIDQCLKDIAEKFGINDYFIRDGYYGLDSMRRYEVREFANGYHIENERIRPDENDKSTEDVFENIYQGMPAFDIIKADKDLVSGREYSVTVVNTGGGGAGFSFCIESEELHRVIAEGLKKGTVPVNVSKCSYTVGNRTVDVECEYKLFHGRYAFLFEANEEDIPDGVVVHPHNIKTDEDKKMAEAAKKQASVTVRFVFESETPLNDELDILLIPVANFRMGVGCHKTKLTNEV